MRTAMRGGWRAMSNARSVRLQEAMDAHVMHVYPKGLVRALDHSDRHGTPTLHEQPRGKALATLRNAKNQRFLWQEAAKLNATKQSKIVIDVLYNEIFKKMEHSPHVLSRTKSLFLQQTLLAGIATDSPSIALVALQKLAALDTTLIPQSIRNQCVDAVVRLAIEKDAALLIDIVPLIKQFNVTVDAHVAAALLDGLFHHNSPMALLAFASTLPTTLVLPLSTQCQIFVSMLRHGFTYAEVNAKYLEILSEFHQVSHDNVLGFLLSTACMEGAYDVILDVLEWMEKWSIPLYTEDALSLYHVLLVPHGTKFYESPPVAVNEQCIVDLFNAFPKALPSTTTQVSLAISAASFLNQHEVTSALFAFANEKNISVLDVAYGHAGATASSQVRQRFNSLYKANHRDGKVIMAQQWNVDDPGYHFSGSLLQFMCKHNAKDNVLLLLKEMQYYHVEASESDMKHVLKCLTFSNAPVKNLYNLYEEFPLVIKNAPIALTQGIVSLLSDNSKFEEAMQLWRCFVWTESILLDQSIFAELIYAAMKYKLASSTLDEITTQYTQRGMTLSQLHSEVLSLCQKYGDVTTMTELLLTRSVELPPLNDNDIQVVMATLQSPPLPFFKRLPKRVVKWENPTFLSLALRASLKARQWMDCLELMGMAIDNSIELTPEACLACSNALQDESLDAQFAERQDDSKHFAASYWKQQLLDAKEQLHASLSVHRRELETLERHQRLNHALDISLPTEESLAQSRLDTLRTIVKRDYQRNIVNDDFLDQGDVSFVANPAQLFDDVQAFFTDRQERVQVYNSNKLVHLTREYTITSELLQAIDKHRAAVKEEEEAVALHLARLKMKNAYELIDLQLYLRALEAEYGLRKISSRFACRMKWISMSHRDLLRRRINEITRVIKEPNAPPCFLDSSNAIDQAIVALLAKLGLDSRPELETDDDLYEAVRQLFPALFTRYLEPPAPGIPSSKAESSIFPHVSSIERQQELQLLRQGNPDMLLETEAAFISVNQVSRVLDRLEMLARSHQSRSQPPSKEATSHDYDRINEAKLKSYYLLRHLYLRQCKHRVLHLLNVSRSIENSVLSQSTDRIVVDPTTNGLSVVDAAGKQIVYEAALDDIKALDRRLNSLGTHFLRNAEKQSSQIIDRTSMLCDLYECFLWYLDTKVRLLSYLFDHIYLETSSRAVQTSIRQSIVTLVASQALVDFSQSYFWEAFTTQIVAFQVECKLLLDVSASLPARTAEFFSFAPVEILAQVYAVVQDTKQSASVRMGKLSFMQLLALDRVVLEQAVVLWHEVVNEDRQFKSHSTTITNAMFTQYYVGDALIEKAVNELARGGIEHMTYLCRGIRFFQLQTEIASLLYATAHVEMLGRQQFSLMPQEKANYLSQSLAIEALDFACVTRVASMLDWVQLQIATEGRLEWLLAAKTVQTLELRFIETCVTFNAMLLHPVHDFHTIYPWLFDKHMKKIKSNMHLDASQRSYLMHLDSAVGQRLLAEKVEVKVREELKLVGNYCVSFDTKRQSIQSELNGAFEIRQTKNACDDILRYDMIREYLRQLNDDVQVERLLEELHETWNSISQLGQSVHEPLTNPFTPLQPDPLETWFLQELLPLDERVAFKLEEQWDPMQHLLKLPSARTIVRQYAENDTIRPTLHVIAAFQALVNTYHFRAVLHRHFVDDVFGHEIRELVNQLELHCQSKQNPLLVMREWLENKLESMHTTVFLTIKVLVDDVLPLRQKQPLLAEGRSVFKEASVPAAANLLLGLSDLDCETLRVFWRNLETRAVDHHGIVYLQKYEAFVSLKRYYLTALAPNSLDKHESLQMIQMKEVTIPQSTTTSSKRSSTVAKEFDVPEVRILDQFIDNLRNYIEMKLVQADMHQCSQLFQSILTPPPVSTPPESYAPAVEGIIASLMETMSQSKEEFKTVAGQFVDIVKDACHQQLASQNQSLGQENTQLRLRIQTMEKTQRELETKLQRSLHETEYDRNAAVVDKTYGIIFQLENSRHELATAADEFEIERGRILTQVHSEYERKLRDLSLDLVAKQGKFDEYRAAVQNDLRHQIQTLHKAAIEKFIESGAIPMQIKAQLVRSIRTNDEVEKIMDENTDLKHALLKMRTMYELREVSLATAHEKALGVLRTQISKSKLVVHQKALVDAQLQATRSELVDLRKQITNLTSSDGQRLLRRHPSVKSDAFTCLASFTERIQQRHDSQHIKEEVHRVGDEEPQDEMTKANLPEETEDDTEAEPSTNDPKENLEGDDNARKHYIRSVQHLHREIQRLQAQVKKEMRLKTIALDQLQHARANAQALVDADFAKLREEASQANENYAEAIRELNALRSVLEPPKPFHRTQRIAMSPRPKTSSCQRQYDSPIKPPVARPQTSRAGPSTRTLRSNQTTVESIVESRPKSAYSTKVRQVLQQEIAGTNQSLVPRLHPLYR